MGCLKRKWSNNFLGLVLHWFYDSLQSRRHKADHKSHLTFSIIGSYLFDKPVETNGNIPRVKALLGKREPNESCLTTSVTLLPAVTLSCRGL